MDYTELIEYGNREIPFFRKMGITVEKIEPGYARVSKKINVDDLNIFNQAHGGVFYTVADVTASSALAAYERKCVTTSGSYHYFRTANLGDVVTAEAFEIKHGKRLSFCNVEIKDQSDTLLGFGTFSFSYFDEPLLK